MLADSHSREDTFKRLQTMRLSALENVLVYVIGGVYTLHWLTNHCYCLQKHNINKNNKSVLSESVINNSQQADGKNDPFYSEIFENRATYFPEWINSEYELLISEPLVEDSPIDIFKTNVSSITGLNLKRDVRERGLTHEEEMKLLFLHNLYRGNVTPPAANMAFMEWDEELAELAQKWSDGCTFKHGMPQHNYPDSVGQNLFKGFDPTGQDGVWLWFDEYHDYDLRKGFCLPDKKCGHYIQMAWAESSKLGCGMKKCGIQYLVTCHYSPRYNAFKGTQMFLVGKPCSQCNEPGSICYKNLCITKEQCKRNPKECAEAKCNLKCHNCGLLDKENCKCNCPDGWDSPDCSKSFEENNMINVCCKGIFCQNGYVLDMDRKPCRCHLLCPGPDCDIDPSSASALQTHALWLIVAFVFLKVVTFCL
ncbi:cysteine-rich secretory protein 2-like isoform X3 [Stegodyphus dumicola]|uniref:cysteine-rich secretory protein 2-like isoform X3 n=1 Tax=Stegodyphus dumicola TaxID=202533 RepID=UPI0015A84C0B|nr:cysteine-rich secretory protein 2-like isoform X3 [Stegodyphus dumicola]